MIKFFRRNSHVVAITLINCFLLQIGPTHVAYALTSGPTQPEVHAFQQASTTDMVDLFTGDFSYNIPLFELPGPNGGYPFNLSYASGISMDEEASWVGLGWSLQPGSISRQMRGLPDEFNGNSENDRIVTKMSIAPNVTIGVGAGTGGEVFGGKMKLQVGFSIYNNTYKGVGHSLDATVGFEKAIKGATGKLGLNLSVDSNDGVGLNPTLGLGSKIGEIGIHAHYNSTRGLNAVSFSLDKKWEPKRGKTFHMSSFSSISLLPVSYTPQIAMPMNNFSLSLQLQGGAGWWGAHPYGYVRGFYNNQKLADDGTAVTTKAFGYLNYQHAEKTDIQDFNREKEGMVSKEIPNLPIPSLTYDIYNVSGQGIGMMYRPLRNDIGVIFDKATTSVGNSVGAGVDVAPFASHIGLNLSLNHSSSTTGPWSGTDQLSLASDFKEEIPDNPFEPWYFKVRGQASAEPSTYLQEIGGIEPVRPTLSSPQDDPALQPMLESRHAVPLPVPQNVRSRERAARSHPIISITNGQLLTGSEEKLPYLKIYLADGSKFNRLGTLGNSIPSNHFAAHIATNDQGLRYVYGLPAYNKMQEEYSFSVKTVDENGRAYVDGDGAGDITHDVSNTDEFKKRSRINKFAYAHLLTAILGPDYVDVGNDGIDDKDLGYWVKFTYTRTASMENAYQWRDPYYGAHYSEGYKTDPRDDRGSFVYGQKEQWYLSSAETKTHKALFTIDQRDDARGVSDVFQKQNSTKGAPSYKLNEVKLVSKSNPSVPIKVAKFAYSYDLCKGIENSMNGGGKLTLKEVRFTYGGSTRGALNPYKFAYHNEVNNPGSAENATYDINAYDRWGNYKPYPIGNVRHNHEFPYVDQDIPKSTRDARASAWSLKKIELPSGASIIVDYESDDYAYVQNRQAMRMYRLHHPTIPTASEPYQIDFTNGKVVFKLDSLLPATASAAEQQAEVLKYIDKETWQLYFKLYMCLSRQSQGKYEFVEGYADIKKDGVFQMILGQPDAENKRWFEYGSFELLPETNAGGILGHPFTRRAWQHIRTNQPGLAMSVQPPSRSTDEKAIIEAVTGLVAMFDKVNQMAKGFNKYCLDYGIGTAIDPSKSLIRLNSIKKKKFGGGHRVRQISIVDSWYNIASDQTAQRDTESVYGQVYMYTTEEDESGFSISSGVAAYEPMVGGEENPLRFAKKFTESVPLRSDNNLFLEYPLNESYYPGPHVGYSKVTVMSLGSAARAGYPLLNISHLPSGTKFGTGGKEVSEFYTAKDFPVISNEIEKQDREDKRVIPIPLIGNISVCKLTSTQGYSLIANDMHGKLKRTSRYKQSGETGAFESDPISWIRYNYLFETETVKDKEVKVLSNLMKDNGDGSLSLIATNENPPVKSYFGQEIEIFNDVREFEDKTWEGGFTGNTDVMVVPLGFIPVTIPVPTVWPSIGKSTTRVRTAVTNKIIYRSGILTGMDAFDDNSLVKTTNEKWDKVTGSVILSKVTNDFDEPVFTYNHFAFKEYQGMGAAFQNIGLKLELSSFGPIESRPNYYTCKLAAAVAQKIQEGDELLLYDAGSSWEGPVGLAVYVTNDRGLYQFYSDVSLNALNYRAIIIRSGFRNHLQVVAGKIKALGDPVNPSIDPSVKGSAKFYDKKISIP